MNRSLLFLLISLLIFSCTSTEYENVTFLDNKQLTYYKLEMSNIYENIAMKPSEIIVLDSLIVLLDKTPNGKIKILNLMNGVIRSFINQGRARGEVLGAYDLDYIRETNQIALLDVTSCNILTCSLDSIDVMGYYPDQTYDIKSSGFNLFTDIAFDGTNIYCSGCFDELRFFKYDLLKRAVVDSIRYNPDIDGKEIDRFINQAYMGTIEFSPNNNKIAFGCRYADQLEIYDIESDIVKYIKGPVLFEPEYKIVGTNIGKALTHSETERKGYIEIVVDDDYIYALYSGRTKQEGRSSYGNEVRKFTWDGDYLISYLLDSDIISFDIDDENNLYAISYDGNIIKYDIDTY